MAVLVTAIHVFVFQTSKAWMAPELGLAQVPHDRMPQVG